MQVRLLVVEDDPSTLALFRQALRDLNIHVRFAASSEEALRLIQAEVPDMVLADLGLPGMDGLALLEQVAQEHPLTLVVLHTASDVPRKGFDIPVLSKPMSVDVLRAVLAELAGAAEQRRLGNR